MAKPKQEELPGMLERPEPSKRMLKLHEAIIDVCELLAGFDIPAGAKVQLRREFKGNKITITFESEDSRT